LFLIADQRKDTFQYDVSVQMIEIYNEQVRDLLVTDGTNKRYPLPVYLILFRFVHNYEVLSVLFLYDLRNYSTLR